MRRLWAGLLASSAMGAMGSAAWAAELPSWSGFYLGGHGGLRWAGADLTTGAYVIPGFSFSVPARSESFHPASGIFGLHGGYNYQFNPNWLMGIETDLSWGNGSFVVNDGQSGLRGRTSTVELGWQASVRGRLGWISGPFLFYGTGGVAFTRAEWNETWVDLGGGPTSVSTSKTLTGWTVGFGVDHLYPTGWLIRAEYLYADYGNFSVPLVFTSMTGKIGITTHVMRAGVSYKFGP